MKLKVGQMAPQFNLSDQAGQIHNLKDYAGKWVLLYFYPKDDTPGCTKEACSFRDNLPKFKKSAVTVLGISIDSVTKHKKFAEKYKLPFTLLADEEKKVVGLYDVWQMKKFMGREYMGTVRTSFLIDPKGKIAKIYEHVKPEIHSTEVLQDLKTLLKK
jgi:peroxiredoxin Q/BCP